MSLFKISRGYVPERSTRQGRRHATARDISDMGFGWLRIAEVEMDIVDEKPIQKIVLPFHNIPIAILNTGYANDERIRSRWGAETPISFAGIIAVEQEVFRTDGIHFRSGRHQGRLIVTEARPGDLEVLEVLQFEDRVRRVSPDPQ